ncbi:MAG: hypothetical protein M1370_10000 [Bacteroidetes bacterium]|nr:hypothetical protein [Bacteroidota bacterium]MCL5025006.1 hypothetical protein [Chloroflexota bacterium]
MELSDSSTDNNVDPSKILRLDSVWYKEPDPQFEQLTDNIIFRVRELQRKNSELVGLGKRNAELLLALQQSLERVAEAQRTTLAHRDMAQIVIMTVGQMLERADDAISLMQVAMKHEYAHGYGEVIRRTTALQKEIDSLLEGEGDEELVQDEGEVQRRTAEFFRQAGNSILSIAGLLQELLAEREHSQRQQPVGEKVDEARRTAAPRSDVPTPADQPADDDRVTGAVRHKGASAGAASVPEPAGDAQDIEIVASPLGSLAALTAFCKAVREVAGVIEMKTEDFDRDTLRLKVRYSGRGPLASLLMKLPGFSVRLVQLGVGRVVIGIGARRPVAAGWKAS